MMDPDLEIELALANRLGWELDRVLALSTTEITFRLAQIELANWRAKQAR